MSPLEAFDKLLSIDKSSARRAARDRIGTLAQLAATRNLLFGTAAEANYFRDDPAYGDLVARQCSLLVPEASLKPRATRQSPNAFDFEKAELLQAFAVRNNLAFRGHTLVWHHLPDWLNHITDAAKLRDEFELECTVPVRHFRGRIDSWDVVNEPILVTDGQPEGYRNSFWYKALGQEYVSIAFHLARAADPGAVLVLNDYYLEADTPADADKRSAMLALLKNLKRRNVPVDALGIQSHLGSQKKLRPFSAAVFSRFLSEVEELGLKVLITELDVTDALLPADVGVRDEMVAEQIRDFLNVVLTFGNVVSVGVWGLSDSHSWIQNYYPRSDGLMARSTPFDSTLQPKLAFKAIEAAFEQTDQR